MSAGEGGRGENEKSKDGCTTWLSEERQDCHTAGPSFPRKPCLKTTDHIKATVRHFLLLPTRGSGNRFSRWPQKVDQV
jgi:hypothetical protein